jgi:ABC-2 type transport system permease protein
VLLKVITFYYIGAVFESGRQPALAGFGHNYFAFLIIGLALTDFVATSLDTFSTSIRDSQMAGTLEVVLLSPIRLTEMVVYSSLWPYLLPPSGSARMSASAGCSSGCRSIRRGCRQGSRSCC